jgi:hypothetical protein
LFTNCFHFVRVSGLQKFRTEVLNLLFQGPTTPAKGRVCKFVAYPTLWVYTAEYLGVGLRSTAGTDEGLEVRSAVVLFDVLVKSPDAPFLLTQREFQLFIEAVNAFHIVGAE